MVTDGGSKLTFVNKTKKGGNVSTKTRPARSFGRFGGASHTPRPRPMHTFFGPSSDHPGASQITVF